MIESSIAPSLGYIKDKLMSHDFLLVLVQVDCHRTLTLEIFFKCVKTVFRNNVITLYFL